MKDDSMYIGPHAHDKQYHDCAKLGRLTSNVS